MKIAYLITAHNQPSHLHRLVDALNTNNSAFFIHLDNKSDIREFKPEIYPKNVKFLDNRIRVNHGGFSLVQAMIQLIKTAFNADDFDYFQFLSGWDYPIKSTKFIYDFLSQSYPTNFINFYQLTKSADFVENITKYYYIDLVGNSPSFMEKPLKTFQYILKKTKYDRPFIPGMVPYRGSCWFCLNILTITYIINFLGTDNGRRYYNYFKMTQCADEIFFHTIVLNSPLAEFCRFYNGDEYAMSKNENKAYLHYIDWDQKRENPAIFDLNDFQTLMNSSALYARKFSETKSSLLLDLIDHQIKETSDQDFSF
jgi:hypothetical protein